MKGLELCALILGTTVLVAGVWETTKQVLADDMPHLSLPRWCAVYALAVVPFVTVGLPLIWLGAPALTH